MENTNANKDLDLIVVKDSKSIMSERYRALRTNIQFYSIDKDIKSILITSSIPGEGKSTIASNLAVVLSQMNKKVMIIDCDQRRPNIHKIFKLSNLNGLSNYLVDNVDIASVIQNTCIENLDAITSGITSSNPADILSSYKMKNTINKLEMIYDYIIIDAPPVGLVIDAQIIAKYVGGTLFVVESNKEDVHSVAKSKKLLDKVGANIIGVVLNKTESKKCINYYDSKVNIINKKNSSKVMI